MLGVEDELGVDLRERRRLVRLEDVAVERALEQIVVDAEEHVALWVAFRQQRSRHDLAGVSGLEDLELRGRSRPRTPSSLPVRSRMRRG